MIMDQQKNSCLLYRTIVEAAKEMDKDEALELLLTYADYALGDTETIETDNKYIRLILKQVVPSLKAAENRYDAAVENGNKGKDYGKNGGGIGRPRKGESQEDYQKRVEEWKKSKNPQNNPQRVNEPVITSDNPQKPLNNPIITPVNNPVFEKTPLQAIQNPQKNPLDVDEAIDVEEDVYIEEAIAIEEEYKEENIVIEKDKKYYVQLFLNYNNYFDYSLLRTNPDYFYKKYQYSIDKLRDNILTHTGESMTIQELLDYLNGYLAELRR